MEKISIAIGQLDIKQLKSLVKNRWFSSTLMQLLSH